VAAGEPGTSAGPIRETFHTSAGVELNVKVDGPVAAPVTIVLTHGWTLDVRSWGPVARALTAPGRPPIRVIRYDHRGHGRSASIARERMTIEGLADDLAELFGELVPDGPVVLGGHSMGGMTIMALAERHPELFAQRVGGVALVSTAAGGLADNTLGLSVRALGALRRGEARLARSARWASRPVFTRRPALLAPGMRFLLLGPGADRGALRITAQCVADCRPDSMIGFRPTLDAHDRDAALEAFDAIPTEVLVGTRDRLTPVHHSRRIVRGAQKARLRVYPGAGHMLPLERVDAVAERLAELAATAGAASRAPSGSGPGPARPAGT
jgi:pimeloyl-ACP methyl ester carboxylesterase